MSELGELFIVVGLATLAAVLAIFIYDVCNPRR
jgi:hypothetical protein